MTRVAILSSHLAAGDAVSNDVIGMCAAFERRGHEARIFAGSSDLSELKTYHPSELHQFVTNPDDLLIYHHSIEWTPGLELLQQARCRTAIKYHNVTPPEYFVGISPWHEEKCRAGREELQEIVRRGCDIYLADSEYNRNELLLHGAPAERCFVVPPFHHIDHLEFAEADLETLDRYRDGRANVLMVGRVSPNKRHDDLIKAFAIYHSDHNQHSRLLVVGKEEAAFESYSRTLRELAAFLDLHDQVVFAGSASISELKAFYLLSNVFAIASEHEGFCVPLVEAMSMKVPVVAYAGTAIPDTVGAAGVVLDEREPRLMAAAIDYLVKDESLNFNLGLMGKQRYEEHFTNQVIEGRLFQAVSRLETVAAAG
jgi:glycosyltransferase involved in cell wall biosynthesis